MSLKVLVAEEDLHAHKVIHDILEMSIKDVKITRALGCDSFLAKITKSRSAFDLLLFDFHFDEPRGLPALLDLIKQRPDLAAKTVLLNESVQEMSLSPLTSQLQYILKPFSLDKFSEVVKRFRASDH